MKWEVKTFNGKLKLEGSSYEEAGAEIYEIKEGVYELYEITQYGTATLFVGIYKTPSAAMTAAEEWT